MIAPKQLQPITLVLTALSRAFQIHSPVHLPFRTQDPAAWHPQALECWKGKKKCSHRHGFKASGEHDMVSLPLPEPGWSGNKLITDEVWPLGKGSSTHPTFGVLQLQIAHGTGWGPWRNMALGSTTFVLQFPASHNAVLNFSQRNGQKAGKALGVLLLEAVPFSNSTETTEAVDPSSCWPFSHQRTGLEERGCM